MVVSISPQSTASVAAAYNLSAHEVSLWLPQQAPTLLRPVVLICMLFVLLQTAFKLVSFLKHIGVDYVFDTTFSRDLALLERWVHDCIGLYLYNY